jgi:transcription initiation factor IIF auxiliary subunit
MALSIQQHQEYVGDDRWQWSVWLDGTRQELDSIDHVMYILDWTFPKPVRRVMDRSTNFRLEEKTWGKFTLRAIAIDRAGGQTPLHHDLVLLYPDGTPTLV